MVVVYVNMNMWVIQISNTEVFLLETIASATVPKHRGPMCSLLTEESCKYPTLPYPSTLSLA